MTRLLTPSHLALKRVKRVPGHRHAHAMRIHQTPTCFPLTLAADPAEHCDSGAGGCGGPHRGGPARQPRGSGLRVGSGARVAEAAGRVPAGAAGGGARRAQNHAGVRGPAGPVVADYSCAVGSRHTGGRETSRLSSDTGRAGGAAPSTTRASGGREGGRAWRRSNRLVLYPSAARRGRELIAAACAHAVPARGQDGQPDLQHTGAREGKGGRQGGACSQRQASPGQSACRSTAPGARPPPQRRLPLLRRLCWMLPRFTSTS